MAATKPTQAPSFSDRAAEAGLPTMISREEVASLGTVTWLEAAPTTARNPSTGELDPVLRALIETDAGKQYYTIIGNVALEQVLSKVELPMRASIHKNGRTWVFGD